MMQFWIGGALLLAFLALPFIARGRRQVEQASQLELNKQIFKQRLAELELQLSQQELSEQEFQQLKAELQAGLLDDAAEPDQTLFVAGPKAPLWALVIGIAVASTALYIGMGNYREVEQWQQAMEEMPELAKKLRSKTDKMTPEELERFALALRTRLNQDDSDAMGWLLYGRIQMSFGRVNEATEALVKALHLDPNNPSINLAYAAVLARSGEPAKVDQAKGIYARLRSANPDNLDILSQQAFTLFEIGDKAGAYRTWQTMLTKLPKESARYQQIERTLAMLKGEQPSPHAQQVAPEPPNTQQNVTAENSISVTVAIENEAALPPQGFLVIFARAVQGAPMPMAVKRLPLGELPVEVTLSDADAMMENYPIGAVEPFEVVAKVVENADVATATSLLEAKSQPLTKADLPTALTIKLKSVSQ